MASVVVTLKLDIHAGGSDDPSFPLSLGIQTLRPENATTDHVAILVNGLAWATVLALAGKLPWRFKATTTMMQIQTTMPQKTKSENGREIIFGGDEGDTSRLPECELSIVCGDHL
jgi:hypothetical protein